MMRIALVEDDPKVQETMIAHIDRFYHGEKSRYSIRQYYDGDEITENCAADAMLCLG